MSGIVTTSLGKRELPALLIIDLKYVCRNLFTISLGAISRLCSVIVALFVSPLLFSLINMHGHC